METGNKNGKDIISTIPHDILSLILSRLTIKEAGKTSVLSKQWRFKWRLFCGILIFDASVRLFNLRREYIPTLQKCNIFVSKWEMFMSNIEHVLSSLTSDEFRGLKIHFDFGNPTKLCDFFEVVSKKNIQILELDFSFHFLMLFWHISETIRNVLPRGFEMKSLKELRLTSVEVTGAVIEEFLAKCPCLEKLYIRDSRSISKLKVCGENLPLKSLELIECSVDNLIISALNLVSFSFRGYIGLFSFKNVPELVEAYFGGYSSSQIQMEMQNHSVRVHTLFSNLIVLKLELFGLHLDTSLEGLQVFNNVHQLELMIRQGLNRQLNLPISLLAAFPSIRVLKLKFRRFVFIPPEEEPAWISNMETVLQELEVLEISGCRNDDSQNELMMRIINNAPKLKRIVLDPVSYAHDGRSDEFRSMMKSQHRDFNLWFADTLKSRVQPHVELVVL